MPAEAGMSPIHKCNHTGNGQLSPADICSGIELPVSLARALCATFCLQTFDLNTNSSEVINTSWWIRANQLEVSGTMLIERLAPNGMRYNTFEGTSVLALKNSECRERCCLQISILRATTSMATQRTSWTQHIRPALQLRPSSWRMGSVRILKDLNCPP